jgi:hypothetical protein
MNRGRCGFVEKKWCEELERKERKTERGETYRRQASRPTIAMVNTIWAVFPLCFSLSILLLVLSERRENGEVSPYCNHCY